MARECAPKSIAFTEDKCERAPGSVDIEVGKGEFDDILKSLLLLEGDIVVPLVREDLKLYRKFHSREILGAMRVIAQVRKNKSVMIPTEKIFSLLERALEGERLCSSESKFPPTGITTGFDGRGVRRALERVERRLRYLTEGIASAGMLVYVSPEENNANFDYNLLRSYLSLFGVPSAKK